MTEAQRQMLETLASSVDCLEHAPDGEDITFSGDGIDGPSVGYIKPNGEIAWLTGEPVRPDGPETARGGLIGQQPY